MDEEIAVPKHIVRRRQYLRHEPLAQKSSVHRGLPRCETKPIRVRSSPAPTCPTRGLPTTRQPGETARGWLTISTFGSACRDELRRQHDESFGWAPKRSSLSNFNLLCT